MIFLHDPFLTIAIFVIWAVHIKNRNESDFALLLATVTFTKSKFLAYSSEIPCGFFFISCPVGNLQFDTHCAVPVH